MVAASPARIARIGAQTSVIGAQGEEIQPRIRCISGPGSARMSPVRAMDESSSEISETDAGTVPSAPAGDSVSARASRHLDLPESTVVNRRREKIWNESCKPRPMPQLSLPSALIGFMAGAGCVVLFIGLARPGKDGVSSAREQAPLPCPADVSVDDGEEDLEFMMSEAGMDKHARDQAEAIRGETERRLAEIDGIMIRRLDDWRQPLATLQDMMVELAGVGTGGGTWVGHEMQRNDLTLEEDLLRPNAEALATKQSDGPPATPADPEAMARAKEWEALWTDFESLADSLRAAPEIDDVWKSHLDSTLQEARKAHELLATRLGTLRDGTAAQAVIDFYQDYFAEERAMFQDDDSE